MSRHKLDAMLHCKSPFESNCDMHTDPNITNTMEPRMRWGTYLGPTGNLQGSYKFMLLSTGRNITRGITESVIKQVAKWASKDWAMSGDIHGQIFENWGEGCWRIAFPRYHSRGSRYACPTWKSGDGNSMVEEEQILELSIRRWRESNAGGWKLRDGVQPCCGDTSDKYDEIMEKYIDKDISEKVKIEQQTQQGKIKTITDSM